MPACLLSGAYLWLFSIWPTATNADTFKSLLVFVGGAGAAYGGWRLRALAVEKANADALERRVQVLEMELSLEKDARIESEKQALVLQGEIKALNERPDMTQVATMLAEQDKASELLTRTLYDQHVRIVQALDQLTTRIGAMTGEVTAS